MSDPIRAIVAGVGDAGGTDPVLGHALDLAGRLGATAHLVHAYTPPETVGLGLVAPDYAASIGSPGGWGLPEAGEMGAALLRRLQKHVEAMGAGVPVEYHVAAEPAQTALARVAQEVGADLILVGATRHGQLERAFLGMTAGRTLREARAPVLVLRRPLPSAPARILLTTDLSELSAAACATGVEVARRLFGAGAVQLRCLFAFATLHGDLPPEVGPEAEAACRDQLRRFLEHTLGADVPVEPVVRFGVPLEEIVTEAEGWPADLVLLGTHGRSGFSRLLLGSVAETVVRDAPCNVLVVPAAGEEEP